MAVKLEPVFVDPTQLGIRLGNPLFAAGNLDLLSVPKLGLFCSGQCPGALILKTFDLVRKLRDAGVVFASGFHSPMGKECLKILLRGAQPIVICPARSIHEMLIRPEWRKSFDRRRLLLLSQFERDQNRVIRSLAERRNDMVTRLSSKILVAHAAPRSKTEALALSMTFPTAPLAPWGSNSTRKVITPYSGNEVTVTVQAGKTRKSYTDGLTRLTYPSGRVVSYGYNDEGRIEAAVPGMDLLSPDKYASQIKYHPHGAMSQVALGNGVVEGYGYNDRLQPTSITAVKGADGPLADQHTADPQSWPPANFTGY